MTQISTACHPRSARSFLPAALLLAPALLGPPQHVAENDQARVTTLWRSERALDRYAKEGLGIASGVLDAIESRPDDAPLVSVGIAESTLALRWLDDPSTKAADRKARRKRRRAGEKEEDPSETSGGAQQQLVVPGVAGVDHEGAVVALVPKVHDRVMFGTGLTPTTRWTLALEVARAADEAGDLLGNALKGMQSAGFAGTLEADPFTSTGLRSYQQSLRALEASDGDIDALLGREFPARRTYDPSGPMVAPVDLVAKHCRAAGLSTEDVLALKPRWFLEAGAVGKHPYGWQAVASRRADALALGTTPISAGPFSLKTTLVLFSNDLQVPAQADFVFGDDDGARYILVCNTKEGVYLFRRPERGADYEPIAEMKEISIPPGRPVEISIVWKDHTLVVTVGSVEMAGIVLPEDAMEGLFGFGCHAGGTVLFSDLVFE